MCLNLIFQQKYTKTVTYDLNWIVFFLLRTPKEIHIILQNGLITSDAVRYLNLKLLMDIL